MVKITPEFTALQAKSTEKKPFYIQRGELWAHFRPTAGEFYFLSVEFERILLVFFFHDDKMTVFCKWSFGGSGKERRGGCFLVEMKGSDSEKHLCRDPILVMLSDTRNNNMSLRGKKTNKKKTRSSCGFTWTSLRDEVTAIKHHRITQAPSEKTPEFHFSPIYKASLNILYIH